MINLKKASLLAAVGVMLVPAAAFAAGGYAPHDVVKDARGNVVTSTDGNCVITQWQAKHDECNGVRRPYAKLTEEQRTVYFDFNKSTLNTHEKKKLDDVSRILLVLLLSSKEVESVDIVGFADRIGKASYNKKLSTRRAQTVRSYLASKGLRTRHIRVEGLGDSHPVTNCSNKESRKELIACLAEDRRVEIEVNVRK